MTTNGSNGNLDATRARTDALYRQHGHAVWRICRALLRDRIEAEDAAQQVFLSAHRALLGGAVPREPGAWLAAIARRECWARARSGASAAPTLTLDTGDRVAADALCRAELAVMWDAIADLPRTQREAFLLREIRGLSYGQLERQLERSGPSVRSLLGRARRRLRVRMQDVHTALGGASWLEPLARLLTGGSNPAAPAARAVAVSLGAAAITGGALVTPTMLEHRDGPRSARAAVVQSVRVPPAVPPTGRAGTRTAAEAPVVEVARHSSRDSSPRGERSEHGRQTRVADVRARSGRDGGSEDNSGPSGSSGSGEGGSSGGSDDSGGSGGSGDSGSSGHD